MPADQPEPVRYRRNRGWCVCQPHEAQMWQVTVRGKLIGRYSSKRQALDNMEIESKRRTPVKKYRLGSRMGCRSQR